MELLFLLPWVLGIAVAGFAFSGGDDVAAEDVAAPVPTDPVDANRMIDGSASAETIRGNVGDDFLLGASGGDKLEGGQNDDLLLGEAGNDVIYGGQGYDTILGGAGNDVLAGQDGRDFLVGGAGNDSINGGDGNDTIAGSAGADTLEGGANADLISSVDVGTVLNPLSVNFIKTTTAATTAAGALETYVENLYGTDVVQSDLDRLDDALASANTDVSDDQIFAGSGNDTVISDYSDTVTGGAGNDAIEVISNGAGETVTINDFNVAQDTLRVYVPFGTNITLSYVNGLTPEDGVSLVIPSRTVAVLKGLVAADLPLGLVQWVEV